MSRMIAYALAATAVCAAVLSTATPLDDYVNRDDGHFSYVKLNHTVKGDGFTAEFYNMTSQKWMTEAETNRPIWWHFMAVVIPDNIDNTVDSSFLYITGNSNDHPDDIPKADDEDFVAVQILAMAARCPGVVLWQVPNQPITYVDDPWHAGGRKEDASIAITWWHFMHNPSKPDYVLELPMTKSAVKAMDALELIFPTLLGRNIGKFIVAGASKRGWTTWLAGAVEAVAKNRVIAIIPIVLDAIHINDFLRRQFTFYGAWTFALKDYYNCNVTIDFQLPTAKTLWELVDPWYYRDRLTMPKLAINAGGDEFQMPDDQRFWGKDMPADMHFLLVKNAEHSMATGLLELLPSAGAFAMSVQHNWTRPVITWDINEPNGAVTFNADRAPATVDITFCDSADGVSKGRRDFRWAALNVSSCPVKVFGACVRPLLWETLSGAQATPYLVQNNATSFTATMPMPDGAEAGKWRAFTMELTFKTPDPSKDFLFTIPASVIPFTTPFPMCSGEACHSALC